MTFIEPFRIKVVEPLKLTSREERDRLIKEAGYNVFLISAEDVIIDLLTDSGTGAMSDNQWAGMMLGDESYAYCKNYFHLKKSIEDLLGFKNFLPVHQGRGAEKLLFSTFLNVGDYVVSNTHFDTTRANVEVNGGIAMDFPSPESKDTQTYSPFKGNIDLDKLANFLNETDSSKIKFCLITVTNNSGGGQPVSMKNIRKAKELVSQYGIPLFIDACRFAENAWFIKKREDGYSDKNVREIVKEMFSYADGFTMSAKKDGIVNIGGLIGVRNEDKFEKLTQGLIIMEGYKTYGGLAGRDLEAISRGLYEATEENYLEYRTGQVAYLGEGLKASGVPVLEPFGGHAVYLDALRFLPHLDRSEFPGQILTVELYLEGGIRGVEIGTVMFGKKDPNTGEDIYPELELVRLALPRRVYTKSHIDYVIEKTGELFKRRDGITGLNIVFEAPVLRHFTARFEKKGGK